MVVKWSVRRHVTVFQLELFASYCIHQSSRNNTSPTTTAHCRTVQLFLCPWEGFEVLQSAYLYVCLSVRSHISKIVCLNFPKFFTHVTYDCEPVLLRQCNLSYDQTNHRCKKRFFTFFIFPTFLTFFNVFYFCLRFYNKKRWQKKHPDFLKPATTS